MTHGAGAVLPRFEASVAEDHGGRRFRVSGPDRADAPIQRDCGVPRIAQDEYADMFAALARDFGTRVPRNRLPAAPPGGDSPCRPLLTANISAAIRDGYGDPAVLRVEEEDCYYLTVTSNDAPHSFPILRSDDLVDWQHVGAAFPPGAKPGWAADGEQVGDYWAPELHRVGDDYLLCFSARAKDRSLAIGVARAKHPAGPFETPAEPLLRGGMIDPHLFVERGGAAWLFWKEDSNGRWPRRLARLLCEHPALAGRLFDTEEDRRTAALTMALWPWIATVAPMEQFFLLQLLIEAVVDRFGEVRERLADLPAEFAEGAREVLEAMRTPIYAQRLSPDLTLEGERRIVLVNDLAWEGHLIEGPWVTERDGLHYLFYSGNDFSTAEYGIGVAVAETLLGPYRKMAEPVLRSSRDWSGPGHPSVAPAPDGTPLLFLHAFVPGTAAYKAFRALLAGAIDFAADGVTIRPPGAGISARKA